MTQKRRILIVDDQAQVVFTLQEALSKLSHNFELFTASNGREALLLLQNQSVDLMITDLIMPGMDGVSLTEVVYAMFPATKVIWITSYDMREDDAKRLAVERYLTKPLEISEFRKVVQEVLEIQPQVTNPASHTTQPEITPDPKIKILILEDDADLSELLEQSLQLAGFSTKIAHTISEGQTLLGRFPFDILMIDIHMGQENSLEFIQKTLPMLHNPGLQVVVMSGDPHYRETLSKQGIDFYLEKPFTVGMLVSLINRLAQAK